MRDTIIIISKLKNAAVIWQKLCLLKQYQISRSQTGRYGRGKNSVLLSRQYLNFQNYTSAEAVLPEISMAFFLYWPFSLFWQVHHTHYVYLVALWQQ